MSCGKRSASSNGSTCKQQAAHRGLARAETIDQPALHDILAKAGRQLQLAVRQTSSAHALCAGTMWACMPHSPEKPIGEQYAPGKV